jgi:hypothetical protein
MKMETPDGVPANTFGSSSCQCSRAIFSMPCTSGYAHREESCTHLLIFRPMIRWQRARRIEQGPAPMPAKLLHDKLGEKTGGPQDRLSSTN